MPDPVAKLPDHYFEIYSLAVEMADRISARRLLANSFFATVNTGLITLLGSQKVIPWYVALAGVVLSLVWWGLLRSYQELNSAKFSVINALEERLPASIFTDEWNRLKSRKEQEAESRRIRRMLIKLRQYRELGWVERFVPLMFGVIYGINIAYRVNWSSVWDFLVRTWDRL